jgi:hypothetical protein
MGADPENKSKESLRSSVWFGLIVDGLLLLWIMVTRTEPLLLPSLAVGGLFKGVVVVLRRGRLRQSDHLWLRHGGLFCVLAMMLVAMVMAQFVQRY